MWLSLGAAALAAAAAEVQSYTVYTGASSAAARDAAATQSLLVDLGGAEARAVLASKRMDAP